MHKIIGIGAAEYLKLIAHSEVNSLFSEKLQQILQSEYFKQGFPIPDIVGLGLVGGDPGYSFLTFVDDKRYVDAVRETKNIACVITSPALQSHFDSSEKFIILSENPKYQFFLIYNKLAKIRLESKITNEISKEADISSDAFIATHNVKIESNVLIQSNVTIYPNVVIRSDSIIRSGAVIGAPGFEYKRHNSHVLAVLHDGKTVIGNAAEIGAGTVVGQGFFGKPTIIGSEAKTDNLVSVAHGSVVGDRVLIAAGAVISGNTRIGQDTWIGPGSVLSNGLRIGEGAFIALGSHVFKDVEAGERVIGSPARPLPWREK
jgi:UDP-3-O-[3-hydroxymyristoyl] glucosamine N-acyltransferase